MLILSTIKEGRVLFKKTMMVSLGLLTCSLVPSIQAEDSDNTVAIAAGATGGTLATGLGIYGVKKLVDHLKYQASRNAGIKAADEAADNDTGDTAEAASDTATDAAEKARAAAKQSGIHLYDEINDDDDMPATTPAAVSEEAGANGAKTTNTGATVAEKAVDSGTAGEVPDTLMGAAKQMAQEALEQVPAANDVANYSFGMGGDLGPDTDVEEKIADTTAAAAKSAGQGTEGLAGQAGAGAPDLFEALGDFGM
jgi:hypothetical protein